MFNLAPSELSFREWLGIFNGNKAARKKEKKALRRSVPVCFSACCSSYDPATTDKETMDSLRSTLEGDVLAKAKENIHWVTDGHTVACRLVVEVAPDEVPW